MRRTLISKGPTDLSLINTCMLVDLPDPEELARRAVGAHASL